MITYKLKKDGKIECSGFTSEFTLQDIKNNMERTEKYIKEFTANKVLKESILANILQHNPSIEKMKPEMIHACYMYHEARTEKEMFEKKLKDFNSSVKKDKAELKEILKQIPKLDVK